MKDRPSSNKKICQKHFSCLHSLFQAFRMCALKIHKIKPLSMLMHRKLKWYNYEQCVAKIWFQFGLAI